MLKLSLKKTACIGISVAMMSTTIWADNTKIAMNTSEGNIEIELFNDKAPITTKNFERYIKENFYKGTIFHRVIPNFMIQGGGMTIDMKEKPNHAPIKNEAGNRLANKRGTLAMARTNNPDSASSQFFINVVDNDFLNNAPGQAGYAVFGKVTKGMDVVDKISQVPTQYMGGHGDVPEKPVLIQSVKIISAKK